MKRTFIIALIVLFTVLAFARKTTVTTASAINNGSWAAGDTIVMRNGTWTNQAISLTANGNASNPVVLEAEAAGKVILNGNSRLSIGGSYVLVSGLYFLNGTLSGSAVVEFRTSDNATHCTLKNTAIANYNPASNTVDSKWVSMYGTYNTVDHCSFENKNNSGTLLVVWLTSDVTANHSITNNYFGYRNSNLDANGDELNGQEIIRIGDSSTSMTQANCTITGNYFEKCNGEIEVVSNKSCGNFYSNNLFRECKGMLTLRHGNGCTVAGNYFFGNGVAESGGVRIIGENHKVYNNYFENLRGSGYRAALCMVRGKENSALSEYFQVKNALVAFNTMVNCSQAFSINYNSSTALTLPPVNSVIAHNHIYNSGTSNNNITIDQNYVSAMTLTWKNNLMNQGKFSNFTYNSTQVITGKDPKMTLIQTSTPIYEPGSGSGLLSYLTNEYAEIELDIRGRIREINSKTPGASQISGGSTLSMPEKTKVGAVFFNNPLTQLSVLTVDKPDINISNRTLSLFLAQNANICIFNTNGIKVFESTTMNDVCIQKTLPAGIYSILIRKQSGFTQSQKILIR